MPWFSQLANGLDQFFKYWVIANTDSRKRLTPVDKNYTSFYVQNKGQLHTLIIIISFNLFVFYFTDFPIFLTTKHYSLTPRPSNSQGQKQLMWLFLSAFILFCFVFPFSEICSHLGCKSGYIQTRYILGYIKGLKIYMMK